MLQTEAIRAFDSGGKIKKEINESIKLLHQFRKKYPLGEPGFIVNFQGNDPP
jgi:hypothetical protein